MHKTSTEGKYLHFFGYSFVDDTYLIQSGNTVEEKEVVACRMQSAMDTCEGGLRATGEVSNLKTHFCISYHSDGLKARGDM
jgi:hypothetical protein